MDCIADLKLLTIAEVAELLRVHRATVSRLLKSGDLPYCAIGGRKLIRVRDVHTFLENCIGVSGSREICRS